MQKLVEDERRRPGVFCNNSEVRLQVWLHDKKRTAWDLKLILDDLAREVWSELPAEQRVDRVTQPVHNTFGSYSYVFRLSNLLGTVEVIHSARQMLKSVFAYAMKPRRQRLSPPTSRVNQQPKQDGFESFRFAFDIICEDL